MKFLQKIWAWEKAQMKKPETHASIAMVGAMLIGFSQDNYGLGISLAISLGIVVYTVGRKKKK